MAAESGFCGLIEGGVVRCEMSSLSLQSLFSFYVIISFKMNFKKINYFMIFNSIIKNKLENTSQCLVISLKMCWKITY